MAQSQSLRIAQLSDLHLFADPQKKFLNLNTHESFAAVFTDMQKRYQLDLVILSGDLSHDGSKKSYQRLSEMMSVLDCPVIACCGNHDENEHLEKYFIGHNIIKSKVWHKDNWQLIFLNSQVPGKVYGYLDAAELQYLQTQLNQQHHHTIVCFHHQPVKLNAQWLAPLGLTNAEDFYAHIQGHDQIKAIIFGHAHQEYEGHHGAIALYGTPATSFQFSRQTENFALDKLPPGYRHFELFPDGRITSETIRVPNATGYLAIDYQSHGYK